MLATGGLRLSPPNYFKANVYDLLRMKKVRRRHGIRSGPLGTRFHSGFHRHGEFPGAAKIRLAPKPPQVKAVNRALTLTMLSMEYPMPQDQKDQTTEQNDDLFGPPALIAGEDKARYMRLRAAIEAEIKPKTVFEKMMVHSSSLGIMNKP